MALTSELTLTAFLGTGTRTTTFAPAAVSGISALTITTTSILGQATGDHGTNDTNVCGRRGVIARGADNAD